MPRQSYYAVRDGRSPGVYGDWGSCEQQVKGHPGAQYRRFATEGEARAFVGGDEGAARHGSGSRAEGRVAYSDGSCLRNGRAGASAGYGVCWPEHPQQSQSARLEGRATNQRAELRGAIAAVEQSASMGPGRLELRTDSQYVVKGVNDWMPGWKANDWSRPVQNADLFQRLDGAIAGHAGRVEVRYTPGHAGEPGNEEADRLARAAALEIGGRHQRQDQRRLP
jgi:ribonuclease HI